MEEEEEEVLFSQHSNLDIFRGGEGVAGGLGTALLLASIGLVVVNFMQQEILCNFFVTNDTGVLFARSSSISLPYGLLGSSRKRLMMRRCATGVLWVSGLSTTTVRWTFLCSSGAARI